MQNASMSFVQTGPDPLITGLWRDLPANNKRITGLADPVDATDAVTKQYIAGATEGQISAAFAILQSILNQIANGAVPNGSVSDLAVAVNAAIQSNKISFLQNGSLAVARSLEGKIREQWVSVKDFGAVGNGSTDDTLAIKATFAAAALKVGTTVYFPPGVYQFDGTTPIDITTATEVLGAGKQATRIRFTGAACNFVRYATSGLRAWSFRNMGFAASVNCTSGIILDVADVSSASQDCVIDNLAWRTSPTVRLYDGIRLRPGVQTVHMSNIFFVGACNDAIHIEGANNVHLNNFILDGGGYTGSTGIRVTCTTEVNGVELLQVANGNIGNFANSLVTMGSTQARYGAINGAFFDSVYFDDAKISDSALIRNMVKSRFHKCHFTSGERNGCYILDSRYVQFIDCNFDSNVNHGLRISGTCSHITVSGGNATDNDVRGTGLGTSFNGIIVDGNATYFSITGVDVYGRSGIFGSTSTQQYGIALRAGCDHFIIDNIRGGGNAAGDISNLAGTGANKVVGTIIS